jgi:crotonobetainyl-CoA:carnitine CoA-transferase CaiB-like acyl-CoA transferase
VGVAVSDIFTGLYSVIAIQAALRHAEKDRRGPAYRHGAARHAGLGSGQPEPELSRLGRAPVQMGNAHMNIAPYEVLPVRDGYMILAVGNDGQFQRFCKAVGLEHLATDPDFATNPARVTNRARLREHIVATLEGWDRDPLLAELEKAAVPASPINDIAQMFADPQVVARGMRMDLDDGHGNALPSVRAPMVMGGTPLRYERPSPRLGEHTQEVLAELKKKEAS